MAITRTLRLNLFKWGDRTTDGPTMDQFNEFSDILENKVAIDEQGLLAGRPIAGVRGRYYFATDDGPDGVLYRDTGTSWKTVGPTPDTGAKTAFGSYVGTGDVTRDITLPFSPIIVLLQGDTNTTSLTDNYHGIASPGFGLWNNGSAAVTGYDSNSRYAPVLGDSGTGTTFTVGGIAPQYTNILNVEYRYTAIGASTGS